MDWTDAGETKPSKAIKLILDAEHRSLTNELVKQIRIERPELKI